MCERVGVYVRRRKKKVESHVRMRLAPIDEKKKKKGSWGKQSLKIL